MNTNRRDGFEMPTVLLADTVFFYPGADVHAQPRVAVVVNAMPDYVDLFIMGSGARYKTGVRHRTDPVSQMEHMRVNGCWEYTPQTALLHELLTGKSPDADAQKRELATLRAEYEQAFGEKPAWNMHRNVLKRRLEEKREQTEGATA